MPPGTTVNIRPGHWRRKKLRSVNVATDGTVVASATVSGSESNVTERVVITGLGIVAPNANGLDAYEAALREGKSGIRLLKSFKNSFGCHVAAPRARPSPKHTSRPKPGWP